MSDNDFEVKMELPLFNSLSPSPIMSQQQAFKRSTISGSIALLVAGAFLTFRTYSSVSAHDRRRRLQEDDDPGSIHLGLQCFLYVALSIGILIHLTLLGLIIKYWHSPSVKVSQPIGQSIVVFAGTVALVGGICLVAPASSATCSIAEPLIFSSITLSGASIAAMAWRVDIIVAPSLLYHSRRGGDIADASNFFYGIKVANKNALTRMANFGARKSKISCGPMKTITNKNLLRLIGFLALPQILLQIVILVLSALRNYPSSDSDVCSRPLGLWPTALATVLAILPFCAAIITTASLTGGVAIPPSLFDACAIRSIIYSFAFASIGTVPILAFSETSVNQSTYISIYLLYTAVILIAYLLVWPKLSSLVFVTASVGDENTVTMGVSYQSSINTFTKSDGSKHQFEKARGLFAQGQLFEKMNMPNNSIKVYEQALELWQDQKNDPQRHFTGDFTGFEVQMIRSPQDACLIASLLTSKAQLLENEEKFQKVDGHFSIAAKCHLKALEIYELSPAMESESERSRIFSCFYSLFRLIREGEIEHDFVFEKSLASRFVQETKGSHSYNRACALALNAQMKFRSGLHQDALEEFDEMKKFYNILDSKIIRKLNRIDVCFLAYSRSALWHMEMGDKDSAMRQCETVIKMLDLSLDSLQSENPRGMYAILTPIIAIMMEEQPKRMKILFEKYVLCTKNRRTRMDKLNTVYAGQTKQCDQLDQMGKRTGKSIPDFMKNMHLLLKIKDGSGLEENDPSLILRDDNLGLIGEDHFYISLGLSANTVAAEVCLFLANRRELMDSSRDVFCADLYIFSFVDKGLAFAKIANRFMKENNQVISSIANDRNQSVLTALQALASEIGMKQGPVMRKFSSLYGFSATAVTTQNTLQLKDKETLPHQLLLRHDTAAFVGSSHSCLVSDFKKALAEEPRRKWAAIYVFYLSNPMIENSQPSCKENGASWKHEYKKSEHLREKLLSRNELITLLADKAEKLHFYEITSQCSFFGSWFGWRSPGGYINVNPSIWGVDIKMSPKQTFIWDFGKEPSNDFCAFSQGIENLISSTNTFATPFDCSTESAPGKVRPSRSQSFPPGLSQSQDADEKSCQSQKEFEEFLKFVNKSSSDK